MRSHLSIIKDEAGHDLLRCSKSFVKRGIVIESEIPAEDVEGSFDRCHGVFSLRSCGCEGFLTCRDISGKA